MGAGQEQRGGEGKEEVYPLRPSLFPHMSPFLRFVPIQGNTVFKTDLPEELREMVWQVRLEGEAEPENLERVVF